MLRDGTGDVWTARDEDDTYTRAGDKPTVDVTCAVAAHRHARVVARMRFVDLKRVHAHSFAAFIYTGERTVMALLNAGPGKRAGRHQLIDYNSGRVKCPELTHDIDYAAERVVMRIPRSCISSPAWVRLSMFNSMYTSTNATFREFTDNSHNRRSAAGVTYRLYRG
ncbi:MAG: hypothetical protein H0V02_03060 [Nocardioidaceae bacterium]|nr:hypothetical protein [Nocardioidaceae bacterium]